MTRVAAWAPDDRCDRFCVRQKRERIGDPCKCTIVRCGSIGSNTTGSVLRSSVMNILGFQLKKKCLKRPKQAHWSEDLLKRLNFEPLESFSTNTISRFCSGPFIKTCFICPKERAVTRLICLGNEIA
jgi:hypothetical protein